MHKVGTNVYEAVGGTTGRLYVVHRVNRSRFRGIWDICAAGGARYATFVTLPGARRWVREH